MKFENFTLRAEPYLADAFCPKCGNKVYDIDNGWFSTCWLCVKCEDVYVLDFRKMKTPDIKLAKELVAKKHPNVFDKNKG